MTVFSLEKNSMYYNSEPQPIQQDIHPNIWLAGDSPAGYSAGIILLFMKQKKALWSK